MAVLRQTFVWELEPCKTPDFWKYNADSRGKKRTRSPLVSFLSCLFLHPSASPPLPQAASAQTAPTKMTISDWTARLPPSLQNARRRDLLRGTADLSRSCREKRPQHTWHIGRLELAHRQRRACVPDQAVHLPTYPKRHRLRCNACSFHGVGVLLTVATVATVAAAAATVPKTGDNRRCPQS